MLRPVNDRSVKVNKRFLQELVYLMHRYLTKDHRQNAFVSFQHAGFNRYETSFFKMSEELNAIIELHVSSEEHFIPSNPALSWGHSTTIIEGRIPLLKADKHWDIVWKDTDGP